MERTEILGKSVKGTLEELYSQKMVKSKGILIEADEISDVRMAKYQLLNKQAPEIQREEVIRGDLQTIMMNLLNRQERSERQIVIDSEEKGNISSTVQQLFNQQRDSSVEREEVLRGDIQEAINNLFNGDGSVKHGILIQEDEKGDVQMTIYSLLNKQDSVNVEKEDIVRGDIKSALQRLSSSDKTDQTAKIKVDDTEKGNVNFYSTCIESGALDYLKQLHLGPDETSTDGAEKEKILGGDIKGTKLILCHNQTQIERTVEDVIPGDVHNTVKVFMSEPTLSLERLQKEEIVKGDLRAALNSLSESVNQTVVVEKEEVVKGNIPKALRCLERAQKHYKEVDKPDIIPGNIKGALRSLEKSATSKAEVVVEDLVAGDVKATLKSLERAKQAETIAIAQIHKSVKEEHIQVKREVITTESKDNLNSQQQKAVQKHVKAFQKKKGVTVIQQSAEEPPEESKDVPVTVTGESEQNQLVKSTTGRTEESQRQEVQVLISRIREMHRVSEKTDSKSLKTLLNTVPDWLMSPERKCELEESVVESDAHRNEEILSHVRKLAETKLLHLEDNETVEKHECEPVSETRITGGATPRISKISIGSAKIENQMKKKSSQERRKEEVSPCKSVDLRAPSPSLRMRSPSPTFITIESTRRTESPQRVTPSPTLLHRPPTPPTPPPRRCDTPTSRLTRITPPPTFDRAENLARLKDTTAKLSRGVTPPPILSPQQISEKKSEIVESPASFHRQIKIESQVVEASGTPLATEKPKKSLSEEAQWAHAGEDQGNISKGLNTNEIQHKSETHTLWCQNDPDLVEASDISEPSSASVKEKREFFEGAQQAEVNKTYVRKEPIAIPERLGPDMEDCEAENKNKEKDELPRADLSSLVNKFESPEEKIYIRKELIPLSERLHNDTESTDCDKEKVDILEQGMPTFDIQAIKNVFELGEQSSLFREEKKDQEEPVSSLSETTADTSKRESPQETKGGSRQSTPLPLQKNEVETVPAEPSAFSETKSFTEHFSNVDEFGNKVTGRVRQFSKVLATPFLKRRHHKSQRLSHLVRVPKSELCTVCWRRAYPMDALIVDKKKYHKSCFCCEHCRNKLSLGNYVSLHGHFYCLHHYKQLLKSKGNYDNGLGQKPPAGSGGPIPSDEKLEWRYSMSSISSVDKTHSEFTHIKHKEKALSQSLSGVHLIEAAYARQGQTNNSAVGCWSKAVAYHQDHKSEWDGDTE
ncbi:xin actin-binding repeat-containing protein 2-like protein [Lates japonicus]|uniref:Xin actin-binding repeat-containing protein 2-like protein n=1 Tax=Lates japonicus TaxID=270547 RepID=A0AAD3NA62_LATJO|nr:xin actin-binding repeat-containing protein 2-like protein [Lates japonicus]